MSIDVFLSRLDGVRQTGRDRWLAKCPAHPDKRPSLSVREMDDGRVLLNDFGGCATESILAAVGLEWDALFPERPLEHGKRERRPFPAADILRAVAFEALLAATAASNIARGIELTDVDRARVKLASDRLQRAAEMVDAY